MKKIFAAIEWFSNNISKPLQIFVYIFIVAAIIVSAPLAIKSCGEKPDYSKADAYFVDESAPLHGNNYWIRVLGAETKESISIKREKNDEEPTVLTGHFIAVKICIKQNSDSKKQHELDVDDFKLKDHTGTHIPLNDILSIIDVDAPDLIVGSSDFIDSDVSFPTEEAIEDYTWIGTPVSANQETIITVYFEMEESLNVENTIMIFEADFFVGAGKTNSATDIVLFERKKQ